MPGYEFSEVAKQLWRASIPDGTDDTARLHIAEAIKLAVEVTRELSRGHQVDVAGNPFLWLCKPTKDAEVAAEMLRRLKEKS